MKKQLSRLLSYVLVLLFATSFNIDGLKVGDKASDFSLIDVDGKMVSLKSNAEAKGYILVFTCNTCPFSKLYEQRIIDLHNKYASLGYPVIAINPNDPIKQPGDSFEKMVELAKSKNYPFPYLNDKTQEVALAYGATRTPHVYLLNKEAKDYKIVYIGAIDDNNRDEKEVKSPYVEKAVESLLKGQNVEVKETKAIGCTIKWKDA